MSAHIEKWYKEYISTLKAYDEKKYGYRPRVIREYISRGQIRGYEENQLE